MRQRNGRHRRESSYGTSYSASYAASYTASVEHRIGHRIERTGARGVSAAAAAEDNSQREIGWGHQCCAAGRYSFDSLTVLHDHADGMPVEYWTGGMESVTATAQHDDGILHPDAESHMFGNVVTADLEGAFEESTGRSYASFFKQWVYGAGFPVFQVSSEYDSSSRQLTLHATEIQPRGSLTGYFDAAVDVEALTDAGPVGGVMQVHDGRGELAVSLTSVRAYAGWRSVAACSQRDGRAVVAKRVTRASTGRLEGYAER